MKNFRWFVFLFAASIFFLSIKSSSQSSAEQRAETKRANWMTRQVPKYVMDTAKELGIDILIIDRVSLKGTGPAADKDSSVYKEDVLEKFIAFLRENSALLVKSGIVCQIVSLSRDLAGRWDPITSLTDIPSVRQVRGAPSRIVMSYAGIMLADFCAQTTKSFIIPSIVIDPEVSGNVTLFATRPIPPESLSPILMTVLDNNDAVLIESMGEYQIVPKSKELPGQWRILTDLPLSVFSIKP